MAPFLSVRLGPHNYEGGPSATPTVEGEAVYTFSKKGHLVRLDAATGQSVWARNLTNELDLKLPEWSLAGSPLVEGGVLMCLEHFHQSYSVTGV